MRWIGDLESGVVRLAAGCLLPAWRVLLLALAACGCLFACGSGVAWAVVERGHVYAFSFGSAGSGNGAFDVPQGIAVNEETGRVYVVDSGNDRVQYFSKEGVYEGQFNGSGTLPAEGQAPPTGEFSDPGSIAVDNSTSPSDPSKGDVYVVDRNHNVIDKYTANGGYVGQLTGTPKYTNPREEVIQALSFYSQPPSGFMSVAVAADGRLVVAVTENGDRNWLAWFSNASANVFEKVWGFETRFGFLRSGVAVNAETADVLVKFEGFVAEFTEDGEPLVEDVCKEGGLWPAVEAGTGDMFLGHAGGWRDCAADGVSLIEANDEAGVGVAAGIAVNDVLGRVYVVDEVNDRVDVFGIEPPRPPALLEAAAGKVTSSSVRLSGRINPRSEPSEAGNRTVYWFEYVGCGSFAGCSTAGFEGGVRVGEGSLAASFEPQTVGVTVQGLSADQAYAYRLVAKNVRGTTVSQQGVFVTQPEGGPLLLPDERVWELVSPAQPLGAVPLAITEVGVIQASAEGGGLAYLESSPGESQPAGTGSGLSGTQMLAGRGTGGGWSSVTINAPNCRPTGTKAGFGSEYRFFSRDLSEGMQEKAIETPPSRLEEEEAQAREEKMPRFFCPPSGEVSPLASEYTPLIRHNNSCQSAPASCYEPLVYPGDVPAGSKFEGKTALELVNFRGGTPDLSAIVVASSFSLSDEPPVYAGVGGDSKALYEWDHGRLRVVSALPAGEGGAAVPALYVGPRGGISDDGSRVFFSAKAAGQGSEHLYMRDLRTGQTVRLDQAQGGSPVSLPAASFQAASSDGSRVFFTTAAYLLGAKAGQIAAGAQLYECRIVVEEQAGEPVDKCDLSDLTPTPAPGQPAEGETAGVLGTIPGASQDGSYLYFVATGVQAAGATAGMPNLYEWHEGSIRLIATLSPNDLGDWEGGSALKQLTTRVSPDGQWLAFMSDASLTGYDNHDAVSGKPDEEVFLYHAGSDKPVCVSCNPTGTRPHGVEYAAINGKLVGGDRIWPENQWIAANIPGWTRYAIGGAAHQPRYLSNSGRLFFNTSQKLVPQDTNPNQDVYEYEPAGVGSCTTTTSTYQTGEQGCVSLISSGTAQGESAFLDASENGSDIFFLTKENLTTATSSGALKIYDAHQCTSSAPCQLPTPTQPAACNNTNTCRPQPEEPQPTSIFSAPPTSLLTGNGNLPTTTPTPAKHKTIKKPTRAQKLTKALQACKHKKTSTQRHTCEHNARKHYRPAHAHNSKHGGRAVGRHRKERYGRKGHS